MPFSIRIQYQCFFLSTDLEALKEQEFTSKIKTVNLHNFLSNVKMTPSTFQHLSLWHRNIIHDSLRSELSNTNVDLMSSSLQLVPETLNMLKWFGSNEDLKWKQTVADSQLKGTEPFLHPPLRVNHPEHSKHQGFFFS